MDHATALDLLLARHLGHRHASADLSLDAALDTHLATCADCAHEAARLADAASALPDATLTRPPAALRSAVLGLAAGRRAGTPASVADPVTVHAGELERLLHLLDHYPTGAWARPVAGTWERRGHTWTATDVVVHLAATQAALACRLGVTTPAIADLLPGDGEPIDPAVPDDLEGLAFAAVARHRAGGHSPAAAVEHLRSAARATTTHAATLHEAALDHEIAFYGTSMRTSSALVYNAFETWTHADDLRRAAGLADAPPPAGSVATMADRAVRLLPLSLPFGGVEPPATSVLVHLTGPGGGAWRVALHDDDSEGGPGLDPATLAAAHPGLPLLRADALEWCRAFADRLEPHEWRLDGADRPDLAADIARTINSLAAV